MNTTGRPNLRIGACHQGILTRFPLVARRTLRPSFKALGGALEGKLMSHLAVLAGLVPDSLALKRINLHRE